MMQDRRLEMKAAYSRTVLSRRELLHRTALLMTAAALPLRSMAAENSVSPAMGTLSSYMSEAGARPLPDEVSEAAKFHILDTLAAMISGSELPAGRAALRFVRANGGGTIATVLCSNVLCDPIVAALVNAEMAHADETDDSHAPSVSHPGCSIVPATLAAGERFGINGSHFLRAFALGIDVGTRITMTLGVETLRKAHRDTHSIVAVFGSAAAAACAANLNAHQMRWVLDYAAEQCSGLRAVYSDTEHIEKAFVFAGKPARDGVTAALVVQSDWIGIDDILSGPDNFLMAYSPQADPAGLVDKLGERWEVTRTNIKKWSVASPIEAPLDAMQNLLQQHRFEPDQVQQVIVRIGDGAAGVNNSEMPDICMQHMIAVMMLDKTVSFRAAHDRERMKDPAILRQRAKVQLVADPDLLRLEPRREAIVEVTLVDGTHFSERVTGVRGTVENPMNGGEVAAKFHDLADPVLGTAKCTKLAEQVLGLEKVKDIRTLRPLLQRA
jgi:2-methylcitrate dehydratase PrpD